jgi:hypothetical protein
VHINSQQLLKTSENEQLNLTSTSCRQTFYLRIMGQFSIGDAIKEFLNQSRIKGGIQALQIEDVWEQIMGKTVARYTDKLQIIGDKLIITTNVAPLKHELKYQKEKIKQRVNEALGQKVVNEVIVQ